MDPVSEELRILLDGFRVQQLDIARALTALLGLQLLDGVDIEDIDGSVEKLSKVVREATTQAAHKGIRVAEEFFEAYSETAKLTYPKPVMAQVKRELESREYGLKEQAEYLVAVRPKIRIAEGMDSVEAFELEMARMEAEAARSALDAPSLYVAAGTAAQGQRYRRRVSANCCSWCAVLASVKYRYTSRTREFRSHPYCRCTTEPVAKVEGSKTSLAAEQAWEMVLAHEKKKIAEGQRYFTNVEARRAFRHLWLGWQRTGKLDEANIRDRPEYVKGSKAWLAKQQATTDKE